jgi:hypothetical protein
MDLCEEILKKSKCKLISRYSDYGIASIITKINLKALKSIMELTEVYKIEAIEIKLIENKASTIYATAGTASSPSIVSFFWEIRTNIASFARRLPIFFPLGYEMLLVILAYGGALFTRKYALVL